MRTPKWLRDQKGSAGIIGLIMVVVAAVVIMAVANAAINASNTTTCDGAADVWENLCGGTAIAANGNATINNLTVNGYADIARLLTPWENVVYVAKSGGDYTTIQAALNANPDRGVVFLVAPGTYTEQVTFTNSNQGLIGLGNLYNTRIYQADADVVIAGTHQACYIEGIAMIVGSPTAARDALSVDGGGFVVTYNAGIYVFSTSNIVGVQPHCVAADDSTAWILESIVGYNNDGNAGVGGTAIKVPLYCTGTSTMEVRDCSIGVHTNGTALVTTTAINNATSVVNFQRSGITMVDDGANGAVGLGYLNANEDLHVRWNTVAVTSANNDSYGTLLAGGTGRIISDHNWIYSYAPNGTAYGHSQTGGTGYVDSVFDDIEAADYPYIGDVRITSNTEPGVFSIYGSGTPTAPGTGTFFWSQSAATPAFYVYDGSDWNPL